ncbi:hypothetical protein BDV25DRAFT_145263 [Aspergillus avenaceus]|uniref:GMC oxidoreductase n=1 Tax=Aspergillus avenaceus TaxID=36643 RepID=A0A5N6TEN6_ASPAV|nr:hypothetical protein BDV25DRAFT_145263 [Aspergillus avenaceus]
MSFSPAFRFYIFHLFYHLFVPLSWLTSIFPGVYANEGIFPPTACPHVKEGDPGIDASFDYVVVGGGNAGVTLAARLAEQKFNVALVEAGGFYEDDWPLAEVPGAVAIGTGSDPNSFRTPIDWGFVLDTGPGGNNRRIHYEKPRCVGGSYESTVVSDGEQLYDLSQVCAFVGSIEKALNGNSNGDRPPKGAMQLWADLVEDESYAFDNVFSSFTKTIDFMAPNNGLRDPNATARYRDDAFDANGQPVHVTYPNSAASFSSWVKLGLEAVGIHETVDFNSGSLFGSFYAQYSMNREDQKRSSSESAFFRSPNSERYLQTLTLYKYTMAKRILFHDKRATGVEVTTTGFKYALSASHEVIISAGVFNSPQLLMVSGIGPATILEEHGIDIVVDLPGVGQNLWDHVFFGPTYQVALVTFNKLVSDPAYLIQQIIQYVTRKVGVFTNHGFEFIGFERLPENSRTGFSEQTEKDLLWFPRDWPEYVTAPLYIGNYSDPIAMQPPDGNQYATIVGLLVAPTSRGNVSIISKDTEDLPVVYPNWLSTEADEQVAIAFYKRIRDIFQSEAMAPIILGEEFYPGDKYQSDSEILEVIRQQFMPPWHAACTCKMGTASDPMAVVDSKARVFGVDRLRVVDASAFPILPPGHPHAVVYMLAEKVASDLIGQERPKL